MSLEWPAQIVEATASDEDLQKMVTGVEATFHDLGETEPYWSVLTDDRFRMQNIAQTHDEFYRYGAEGIETVFRALERAGGLPNPGVCAELGCGVGRSTVFLGKRFRQVIGLDISRPHLNVLTQAAQRFGQTNITPVHVNKLAALDGLPEFDFFFTVIVLQHNPPPVMAMLLRKMLSKLKPGGVAYFQLPTYILGYEFRVEQYLTNPHGGIEMHCLPQNQVFRILEQTGCKVLETREDSAAGGVADHFLSNTFIVRRVA